MSEKTRKEISREKRRFWQEQLAAWQHSGLTQAEYCRRQGLKAHRFTYWKQRIEEKARGISFVPVPVGSIKTASAKEASSLALVLGRYRIEIGDDFKPSTLSSLIRALGVQ